MPYKVIILECERGWGQKVDDIEFYSTFDKAKQRVDEFNRIHNTEPSAPDWYMVAQGPYPISDDYIIKILKG